MLRLNDATSPLGDALRGAARTIHSLWVTRPMKAKPYACIAHAEQSPHHRQRHQATPAYIQSSFAASTVDATIDQLLAMSTDVENERLRSQLDAQDLSPMNAPSAQDDHQSESHQRKTFIRSSGNVKGSCQRTDALRDSKNWNPPLLGPLPRSFLRLAAPASSPSLTGAPAATSGATSTGAFSGAASSSPSPGAGLATDLELAQFLEDERMAIFLQNEEFMRELRRNKDFMSSLDEGGGSPIGAGRGADEGQAHMHDDAAFREKLKNMGKVSKRKFAHLARLFQKTGAMASGAKSSKFKHINPLPSRDKLLLGDEALSDGEEPDTPKQKGL